VDDRTIFITQYDVARLRDQIGEVRRTSRGGLDYLDDLETELARACVVAPTEVPPDVVTMNSRLTVVDLDTGEEMEFTLVFHKDADIAQSKISVLAPVGTAVLGYRVGDTFSWVVPDGTRRLKIRDLLYQPEAAGDFEL
jgi:regulator of nucleoside diphosphate kinase